MPLCQAEKLFLDSIDKISKGIYPPIWIGSWAAEIKIDNIIHYLELVEESNYNGLETYKVEHIVIGQSKKG
jgi:hypothetical protein